MHVYFITLENYIKIEDNISYNPNNTKIVKFCEKHFNYLKNKYQNINMVFKKIVLKYGPYSYYEFLKSIWGKDDLILIEHDSLILEKDFIEMIECKYEYVCSALYKSNKLIKNKDEEHYYLICPNRNAIFDKTRETKQIYRGFRRITPLEDIQHFIGGQLEVKHFKDVSNLYDIGGFGFTRIPKKIQEKVMIPINIWNSLDSAFFFAYIKIYGFKKVHNHSYISHLHIF